MLITKGRNTNPALAALTLCLALAPLTGGATGVQADLGFQVIPRPVRIEPATGHFIISPETRLRYTDQAAEPAAQQLGKALHDLTKWDLPPALLTESNPADSILLALDDGLQGHGPEHYQLRIHPDQVTLLAAAPAGLVNGVQTLRQLLPIRRILGLPDKWISWRLPCATIEDYPRFGWRGLMMDCSRTFQSVDDLKKTIDRMAFYKLNVLHLHLTDDQGWRLEIRKHPELTRKGARFPKKWQEPETHQGFYTQTEMREVVAYAADRNITIVPEIEMPGHTLAALACYPDLSCTGGPFEIHPFFKGPNIHPDILCAGNDSVFTFLEEVLAEVMEIFPSSVIHIGGDEAPKVRWQACSKCQARMKDQKLKDEHQLQSWFIQRIEEFVNAQGRHIIGWDEILQGGLAPNAAVMSWRGTKGGIAAAQAGHDVVMSPTSHCYFDYSYERIDTLRAWSFEPTAGLDPEQAERVLGLQANFWSHIDREPALVDRQLFPRLLGIAERGWVPADVRDPDDFLWRVRVHLALLDEMGVAYHRTLPDTAPPSTPGDPVGQWKAPVPETYSPLTWDVTEQLDGPGTYLATLRYSRGSHRLGIERVELLAGDQVVATDRHRGETGTVHRSNRYELSLPDHQTDLTYTLRASARSEGGTDSNGTVFIDKE